MKIIIDSNRVIAALMKNSTTREILFNKNFEFFAPEYVKNSHFLFLVLEHAQDLFLLHQEQSSWMPSKIYIFEISKKEEVFGGLFVDFNFSKPKVF